MGVDEGSWFIFYVGSGLDISGDNKYDFGCFIVGDMF